MEHFQQPPSVAFLFIGGAHQVYHLAPVAAELSNAWPEVDVQCIYPDAATGAALADVRDALGSNRLKLIQVKAPRWAAWLADKLHNHAIVKIPLLLRLAPRLRRTASIVTAERTSAFLRKFGIVRPLFVHFRHGAGDRAPKSEARLAAFDVIVVPGEKDLERAKRVISSSKLAHWFGTGDPTMINFSHGAGDRAVKSERQLGHFDVVVVAAEKDAVRARIGVGRARSRIIRGGYVKLDYLARATTGTTPLFDNGRPTVVYNPHFDASISSWPAAREVVAAFAAQERYNLVVAPHLRLSQDMGPPGLAEWHALAVAGKIVIDLDSTRLIDMTYIRSADFYLGDVSSQLYEFLAVPRPVAFLNIHDADWQNDPRYAGWHLGSVADSVDDVIATIDSARAQHSGLIERQRAAVLEAFGDYEGASARGAAIVAGAIGLAPRETAMLT